MRVSDTGSITARAVVVFAWVNSLRYRCTDACASDGYVFWFRNGPLLRHNFSRILYHMNPEKSSYLERMMCRKMHPKGGATGWDADGGHADVTGAIDTRRWFDQEEIADWNNGVLQMFSR